MRVRRIQPQRLVYPLIKANKAGLDLTITKLETHFLAGGNVDRVINALIAAQRANIEMPFEKACAIDLAGAEALFPTSDYAGLFEQARAQQIPMTIHAGEAAGPESIRQALSFGTKRIGHGITAAGDPALVRQLAEAGVTLEVCPTSNVQTKGAVSLEQHPIRALFDAGVRVTVNSDNMTVSNIDLPREIALLKTHLGFTGEEIGTMQRYAREASFLRD